MKIKTILMSMLAVAALASCNKEEGGVPDAKPVNLGVTFDFSTLKTRAIDGSVPTDVATTIKENLASATLVAYDAAGVTVGEITADAAAIQAIKDGKAAMFHNVKVLPAKVVVTLNSFTAEQEGNVNLLQSTDFVKKQMVYEGVSTTAPTANGTDTADGNTIYEVNVTVKPAMSRFEIGLHENATIQFDQTATKPADKEEGMSRAEAVIAMGSDALLKGAEDDAYNAWKNADPTHTADMDLTKFKYGAIYSYLYGMDESDANSVVVVENVYMNYFYFDRANTDAKLAKYIHNGSDNWDTTATTAYAAAGAASNMNDQITLPVAADKYAAYNLFAAAQVPHVILKVKMPDATYRWFTFTDFVQTAAGNAAVKAIEAGKAYKIDASALDGLEFKLPYKTVLTVSYDGESTTPVVPPVDPTDPKPEDEVKADVKVTVTVSEWVAVPIKPVI